MVVKMTDFRAPGSIQKLHYVLYRLFEIAHKGALRVREAEGHVYDGEGRAAAETAALAKAADVRHRATPLRRSPRCVDHPTRPRAIH